jgi:enoyl-[acyl-carrier protein] reductase I
MAEGGKLMAGKRGIVFGVANNRSIAWGITKAVTDQGAEVALTFQGDAIKKRVEPLAKEIGSKLVLPCDVTDEPSVEAVFAALAKEWGTIDFLVHAVAFSDKEQLDGRYVDTTQDNFTQTLLISCYSFTALARRAEKLMPNGGSLLTLTYYGAEKVMPHYNVMGVAKAALEASVRYLAADLGKGAIRVNAISAGPIRTLAGAGISDARQMFAFQQRHSPLRRGVTLDEIGGAALYLVSDLSTGVTGDVHFVDSGYNIIAMPHPTSLKDETAANEQAIAKDAAQ